MNTAEDLRAELELAQENERLSDERIATLESEVAALRAEVEGMREDAAVGKLVASKMISGNCIPVDRCMVTQDEIESARKELSNG